MRGALLGSKGQKEICSTSDACGSKEQNGIAIPSERSIFGWEIWMKVTKKESPREKYFIQPGCRNESDQNWRQI